MENNKPNKKGEKAILIVAGSIIGIICLIIVVALSINFSNGDKIKDQAKANLNAASKTEVGDVRLMSYDHDKENAVITRVRIVGGVSLEKAKQLVQNAPSTIAKNVSEKEATAIINELKEIDAVAVFTGSKEMVNKHVRVVLMKAGDNVEKTMIVVKEVLGVDTESAAKLLDLLPLTIKKDTTREEAAVIRDEFAQAGAEAVIEELSENGYANIWIKDYGESKDAVANAISNIYGVSLDLAKSKIEKVPCKLQRDVPKDAAEQIKNKLEVVGASVILEETENI